MIQFLVLIGHMYLSGMWLGVAPRTVTKKSCIQKETGLNMLAILGSIINITEGAYVTI